MNTAARFFSKVLIDEETKCWLWVGVRATHGYGQFYVDKKYVGAHRWLYCLLTDTVPQVVMHLCSNKSCVNPAHLKGGTQSENILQWIREGGMPGGHVQPDHARIKLILQEALA